MYEVVDEDLDLHAVWCSNSNRQLVKTTWRKCKERGENSDLAYSGTQQSLFPGQALTVTVAGVVWGGYYPYFQWYGGKIMSSCFNFFG
jgi:hypothetical protein